MLSTVLLIVRRLIETENFSPPPEGAGWLHINRSASVNKEASKFGGGYSFKIVLLCICHLKLDYRIHCFIGYGLISRICAFEKIGTVACIRHRSLCAGTILVSPHDLIRGNVTFDRFWTVAYILVDETSSLR